MPDLRRAVKDSVFTCLFGQMEYALELYRSLHPEDTSVTEQDCEIVTLENVLTSDLYNDFGFRVRNMLLLLMEAQATFSPNVVLRIFLYLAETYKRYVEQYSLNLYGSSPVSIPRPELFVIYTGSKVEVPEMLRLSDLYEGLGNVEVEVKVLRRSGAGDILDQYGRFCEIADECRKLKGQSQEAVSELLRRCREEGVLTAFLADKEKEVSDIMATLFSQQKIWEIHDYNLAKEAEKKGLEKGLEKGMEKGMELNLLANLKALMDKLGYSAEQAMDMLSVPPENRARLLPLL